MKFCVDITFCYNDFPKVVNASSNFWIYLLVGKMFRQKFIKMLKKLLLTSASKTNRTGANNMCG